MQHLDDCFEKIASQAEALEPVLGLVGKGVLAGPTLLKTIASMAGISSARLPTLANSLRVAALAGLLKERGPGEWMALCSKEDAAHLKLMLRGVNIYRQKVHEDEDTVVVVVSKPAAPSQLVSALERTLQGFWGIETTAHAMIGLAHRACQRFTVMTPFVDSAGMERILELFESTTKEVRRELIIRKPIPDAVMSRRNELLALGVHVHDFRIARDASAENETFHAKVVRIDADECYVGSSNMTQWSFDYSLELGFHVRGEAGRRVSQVVDAVLEVSAEVQLLG
jgi:hypothetical protein